MKRLSNYSKLRKIELVKMYSDYLNATRIQRFVRSCWIDGLCPISMEAIRFPCYAFKPNGEGFNRSGGTPFVYYNLPPLVDYLLVSGDFRDPKTRQVYSKETLISIDTHKNKTGMKDKKSVYAASINRNFYRKKRETEEDMLVLERCIDEVVSSIRTSMEVEHTVDQTLILNSFHFPTFHRYFRNALHKSKEQAHQILQNTILVITRTADPNNIKDFILQFMVTLEVTYFQ